MSAVPSTAGVLGEAAFRVVRGNPGPDELAALVAVVSVVRARAAAAHETAGPVTPRATWDRTGDTYSSPLAWVA